MTTYSRFADDALLLRRRSGIERRRIGGWSWLVEALDIGAAAQLRDKFGLRAMRHIVLEADP